MRKHILIFCGLLFLVCACQNRNQVTHNKRKYRKGYYKPNRAKVKHKKSNKEEEYAYDSRSQRKQSQEKKKASQSKENETIIEEEEARTFEEEGPKTPSKSVSSSQDQLDYQNSEEELEKHTSSKKEDISKKEKEESKPKKKKKLNWIYWVSLALLFIIIGLGGFAMHLMLGGAGLLSALVLAIILALVIFGLVFNILNIVKLEKDKPVERKFLLGSSYFFAIFFSIGIIAAIVFLLSILI